MESHLLQMRGLKLNLRLSVYSASSASHLLQMRGLKPKEYYDPRPP